MDFYKNGIRILNIPNTIKRQGHFGTRLVGFNLFQASERFEIQALYRSLIGTTMCGGVTIIDINLGGKYLSVYCYPRFPFLGFSLKSEDDIDPQGVKECNMN